MLRATATRGFWVTTTRGERDITDITSAGVEELIEMFLEDVRKVEEVLYGEVEEDKG